MAATPVNLDTLPVAGATLFGVRVTRVRVELEDGRMQRLELPTDDEEIGPGGSRRGKVGMILDAIDGLRPGERLKGDALAARAGVKVNSNTKSKFSALVKEGLISLTEDGYGRPDE